MIRSVVLALCAGLAAHARAAPNGPPDLPHAGVIGGNAPAIAAPWGPGQPDPSPTKPIPPATLTICPDRGPSGTACAAFPWYPWGQADANNQLVAPGYVAYVQPGTYDVAGFVVANAGECWYVGMGATPADTVIHATNLVLGKAVVDIQSPCHFVNLTIENGDLGYDNRFGEGGVAGVYVENMARPPAGQVASTVTFDQMVFRGSNNGLYGTQPEYDPSAEWTQLVVRGSQFYDNSVFGSGGSHDLYVGSRWLTLSYDTFWTNIDSDDAKSRGGYVYVEDSFFVCWAGGCLDRPNGGMTVGVYNTYWAASTEPVAERGASAGASGNQLLKFGEDGTSNGAEVVGTPWTWTETDSYLIAGTPGAQAAGHCALLMTVPGATIAFTGTTVIWTSADGCIVNGAPYGASGPGTVTGLPLGADGVMAAPADAPLAARFIETWIQPAIDALVGSYP